MDDGGSFDFIFNQSPNITILGFKTFDLDFVLDNHISYLHLQNIYYNIFFQI